MIDFPEVYVNEKNAWKKLDNVGKKYLYILKEGHSKKRLHTEGEKK